MSSEPVAIRVEGLVKRYEIYARPGDRLLQFFIDRWNAFSGGRLSPRYREFTALQGLSITLRKGETVGIIGRNGSGKSTLLQLICGTLTPTDGRIERHGRVAALLELGSGFNPEFSGRENVLLYASVLGLSREQAQARFQEIVAFADIGDFLDQPVKTYSSGMVVRLAFAVIAHVDADILVVDEALAVGDAFFTQKCMRFLRDFMRRGTVLLVSHDTEAIKALCGRVLWLDKGTLVQDGPTKEVCQDYLDQLLSSHKPAARPPSPDPSPADSQNAFDPDPRLSLPGFSSNVLRFSAMPMTGTGAGQGGVTIQGVQVRSAQGQTVDSARAGDVIRLDVEVLFHKDILQPLIGFMLKDRTGQALFGDNTRMTPMPKGPLIRVGQCVRVSFAFEMPHLLSGDYSTVVAVGEGTQAEHVLHHWIHDALHVHSENGCTVHGLVGIPMRNIEVAVLDGDASALNP